MQKDYYGDIYEQNSQKELSSEGNSQLEIMLWILSVLKTV